MTNSNKSTFKVIGLMSGTSLDGLDIAYCHFHLNKGTWEFSIEQTEMIAYTTSFKQELKETIKLPSEKLITFHNTFGTWLGKQTKSFIKKHQLSVDFIASHGHTIFHQPALGITYQAGSGQHLANQSGHMTICDFRTNDVALGGQGAPLVPIGDKLLFTDYEYCLNLGGISNISFDHNQERIAFDISPANMLLNYICKKINIAFDAGGKIASTGKPIPTLLHQLNNLEYYKLPYPKSLGYEWFADQVIPIIENSKGDIKDLLHTTSLHIATQLSQILLAYPKENAKVLITGGGAKNNFLMDQLRNILKNQIEISIPEEKIIDYKEALIFAFMGVLKYRNEINCLSSVTGASKSSSSGTIYIPS